jgi:hypothetical protein
VITLTSEEREKFATYLEWEISTAKGLMEQASKLGLAGEAMRKRLNVEAMASKIIAQKLRSTETMTL